MAEEAKHANEEDEYNTDTIIFHSGLSVDYLLNEEEDSKELNKEEKDKKAAEILLKMYKMQPLMFRFRVQRMMKKYVKDMSEWSVTELTEQQFVNKMDGKVSAPIIQISFRMICESKDLNPGSKAKVSMADIIAFAKGDKSPKHVRVVTVDDAGWVLDAIKKKEFQLDQSKDKDRDTKIDIDQFQNFFKDIGLSPERTAIIFKEIDKNNTGFISVISFSKWRANQKEESLQKILNDKELMSEDVTPQHPDKSTENECFCLLSIYTRLCP